MHIFTTVDLLKEAITALAQEIIQHTNKANVTIIVNRGVSILGNMVFQPPSVSQDHQLHPTGVFAFPKY